MTSLRTRIAKAIAANEAHQGDRVSVTILAGITRQLRRYLRELDADGPTWFGVNGFGPHIDSLIRDSEWHRERGSLERAA